MEIPDPFPFRSIPVPPDVTRVTGCSCGGMEWHAEGCSIFSIDPDVANAAIDEARIRLREYGDLLNAKLKDALNG